MIITKIWTWHLAKTWHSPSLIRVFAKRLMGSYGPHNAASEGSDQKVDRSLPWTQSPTRLFCCTAAHTFLYVLSSNLKKIYEKI